MPIPKPKGLPIPQGAVRYWGLPYHGLVRNGTLTLPNNATMTYLQPDNGSTVVIRNKKKSGLPLTMPMAAYDAAQGFSWLTFAILAGRTKQIAGQNLGGNRFIYIDHRDRPWLMKIYPTGDQWTIDVERRFGLFGQDSVSWIKNRQIYLGNFGEVFSENLDYDDLCQNWDGSSVLLNLRSLPARPGYLATLTRIVDLAITTRDAIPGNDTDVAFSVAHGYLIDTADLYVHEYASWGSQPSGGYACGMMSVASVQYTPSNPPGSYCGEGAYDVGSYSSNGSISGVSLWQDSSFDSGLDEFDQQVIKAYWGHDGELNILDLRVYHSKTSSENDSCSATYAGNTSVNFTAPPNGNTLNGNACSGYATFNWQVALISEMASNSTINRAEEWHGGLYLNGIPVIRWDCAGTWYYHGWSTVSGGGNESGSFVENEPSNYSTLFTTVNGQCQNLQIGDLLTVSGVSDTGSNNGESSYSTTVDGNVYTDPGGGPIAWTLPLMFVKAYANNIFTLHLGDPSDLTPPEYNGHFGIVAEGAKVQSGKLAEPNMNASVNPVGGTCTIDTTNNVCYV